jgi:hypothetical protein
MRSASYIATALGARARSVGLAQLRARGACVDLVQPTRMHAAGRGRSIVYAGYDKTMFISGKRLKYD